MYQHNALKAFHLQHIKARLSGSLPKPFSICRLNATPDMLPNKICVNLKCAITLENKQLSIQELIFMTKSLWTYNNLKSSISRSKTLHICPIISAISSLSWLLFSFSIVLFSLVRLIQATPGSSFVLFLSIPNNLYLNFVIYDSVFSIKHHE